MCCVREALRDRASLAAPEPSRRRRAGNRRRIRDCRLLAQLDRAWTVGGEPHRSQDRHLGEPPPLWGRPANCQGGGTYKLGSPYRIGTRWYVPAEEPGYDKVGLGSWYGSDFHGRKTSNGEVFDMNALTAAHPTLPLPSYAYVTNLSNNRTILVRINDRGPYANDRIVDLSRRSARELGFELHGLTRVRVKYAGRAPLNGNDIHEQRFLAGMRRGPIAAAPSAPYVQTAERAYPAPSQSAASQNSVRAHLAAMIRHVRRHSSGQGRQPAFTGLPRQCRNR